MSLIEVNDLTKSFGSLNVLTGVDLSVEEGERIAIIGGSGCGKSVFLRSLVLLEKPDSGRRSPPPAQMLTRSAGAWAWYFKSFICFRK